MKIKLLLTVASLATAFGMAAESPLWLRDVAVSPNGETVAFTYKGDIYTVPFAGGKATRLTTSQAFDGNPVWSPDGTQIAFASDREGSMDIFIVPATGGTPVRLTTNNAGNETPRAFLNGETYSLNPRSLHRVPPHRDLSKARCTPCPPRPANARRCSSPCP